MNRRRRPTAVRSFSIEKLERRSMLAADVGECIVDPESLGSVGEESQDIQTANCQTTNCWLQPDLWVCVLPVADFIPTDDAVTDDAVTDDAVTDDAVTDDAVTDDAVTDDAVTDDAVTDDAVTDDAVTDDAVTDDAVTDDAVTDDAVTDDAVTDDAVTDDAVTDDAVTSVTDLDIGVPVTDPADEQGLPEGFSLTVQPVTYVFESTGMIAVDPQVIVDPVIGEGLIVGEGLLFQPYEIVMCTLFDTTPVDTSVSLDPLTDPVPTDEQAVDGDDTAVIEKVVIEPWFRRLEDQVVCVDDSAILRCTVTATVAAEQAFIAEVSDAVFAAASPSDNQAPAIVLSHGTPSPSKVTSAATAQAFAAFAASSGQGGGDVQSGLPIVGSRRTARR